MSPMTEDRIETGRSALHPVLPYPCKRAIVEHGFNVDGSGWRTGATAMDPVGSYPTLPTHREQAGNRQPSRT